ncbi:MAG TPA: ABC transporter ATP-binding protein [Povalibacter sp.]|uniref:ABC transporter ATP-binding protein n=1 Tax=Povalibacter sp. TaxID=1962978 RepID=UPI002D03D6AB|nr:ABC transporter ATP-binding protein [Povalibacter sp.]HMN45197.1 ABC transporter ATP-binding protein [Povalibacter sp.]
MADPTVSVRDLTTWRDSKAVLDSISADVLPGDIIGVLGKNGAGKTTLLETLLGFSRPDRGSVAVFGEDALHLSAAAKARIGFLPQQDELFGMLNGRQQLAIVAAFHAHWDHALIERLTAEWTVPLTRRIDSLSVGERQKLGVLAALGHHPDLLVLDEPVASLDPIARRQFLQQLFAIGENERRAVLFSSHIVSDLERAANKVWIVKDGRLHWQGELDALKESVVRLHIRSRAPLPANLAAPNALATRIDGNTAMVTVTQWQPALADTLASQFDARIDVEGLGLEDIFLELHR